MPTMMFWCSSAAPKTKIVLVAVNRGAAATISLGSGLDLPPGTYRGLLANASEVNQGNSLTVASGSAVLVLGPLSALVVESKG